MAQKGRTIGFVLGIQKYPPNGGFIVLFTYTIRVWADSWIKNCEHRPILFLGGPYSDQIITKWVIYYVIIHVCPKYSMGAFFGQVSTPMQSPLNVISRLKLPHSL